MRRSRLGWALFVMLLAAGLPAFGGCGGDDGGTPVYMGGGSGGRNGDGDGDGDGDGGNVDLDAGIDAGPVDPRAPLVDIISPEAVSDPNRDEVITTDSVTVRCRAVMSDHPEASEVDPASVKIGVLLGFDDLGVPMLEEGVVMSVGSDEFETTLSIAAVDNGRVDFGCIASDAREMPIGAIGTVSTLVDHGPKVTILGPAPESTHRPGNVKIEVEIEPWPLTANDQEAGVEVITLAVLGREVEVVADPDREDRYSGVINFADPTLFPMPPSTARIIATATNGRTPTAVTRTELIDIVIDSEPPTITIESPEDRQIVRGQVTFELEIEDMSAIDVNSIVAIVEPYEYRITDWTSNGANKFIGRFDTTDSMYSDIALLTINFEASDSAGNLGTASFNLRLDNVPPVVSLDPPLIRELQVNRALGNVCSAPFDPLGDAVGDLGLSRESSLYRVFTYDDTNRTAGAVLQRVAGVDEDTVQIYAQRDAAIPLLIDSNGDGACDEINRNPSNPPVSLDLLPVDPGGNPLFAPSDSADFVAFDDPSHTPDPGYQCVPGTGNIPDAVCSTTAITRIPHAPYVASRDPVVFAFDPKDPVCAGDSWVNLLSIVGEGWACLAARAEDAIGNVGVSEPIRVCFDDGVGTPECDPSIPSEAPECADDCSSILVPNNMVIVRSD